jgi:hypothetical protein
MAGQKKLHDATVASHKKKTTNNPNKEGGGAIPFHSLATMAGRGEDNSISIPPIPEQTPETPRPRRKTIALGETTLPRSVNLRGTQAISSPAPPHVALPRWGSSSGSLILTRILTRRRPHHLDAVLPNPTRIQAEPLPGAAGGGPPPPPYHRGFARQRRREGEGVVTARVGGGRGRV